MKALIALLSLVVVLLAARAHAEVKTQEVSYKEGDTPLQGFVAWDDAAKGKRPGVLVIHEWWGHNQHARNQAIRLAKAGYVGFALDLYGNGKVATHPKDAQALAAETGRNPKVTKARFEAALATLKKDPHVDPEQIAVFGYCMGGGVALEMARQGEDVDAVVVFHPGLPPPATPAKPGAVKARILVNYGTADAHVTQSSVDSLQKEMTAAKAHIEVINYPGAKHSFTNPDADKVGDSGLGYSAEADQKSWENAMKFLKDTFGAINLLR